MNIKHKCYAHVIPCRKNVSGTGLKRDGSNVGISWSPLLDECVWTDWTVRTLCLSKVSPSPIILLNLKLAVFTFSHIQ